MRLQTQLTYSRCKKAIDNIFHKEIIVCNIVLTRLGTGSCRKRVRLFPPSFSRDLFTHVTSTSFPPRLKEAMVTPTPEINVVNTSVFPDDDFIQTAKQVNEPDFNGYEFYMETMGVTFYRKYREAREHSKLKRRTMLPSFCRAPASTSTRCTE